jgi:hypothetical protein
MEHSRTSSPSAASDGVDFALRFGVAALATWRVTSLLVREDGPAETVARLRERLGPSQLGVMMDCFKCCSIWVAIPFAFFAGKKPHASPGERIVTALALSGCACLLDSLAHPESHPEGDLDELLRAETRSQ